MKRINALMKTEYRSQWQDRPVFLAPRSAPADSTAGPERAGWQAAWRRVRAGLSALTAELRRARARRITHRQLATLDDHLLADIGLRREQLREYADHLVAHPGVRPGLCTVTELSARRPSGEVDVSAERAA